jgi:hypothetical protein
MLLRQESVYTVLVENHYFRGYIISHSSLLTIDPTIMLARGLVRGI